MQLQAKSKSIQRLRNTGRSRTARKRLQCEPFQPSKVIKQVSRAYIGIDLHSDTCVLEATTKKGKTLCKWRFPTSGKELIAHVTAVTAKKRSIIIEEAPLAQWAIDILRPHCNSIIACDPKKNSQISKSSTKRDEEDTSNLCEVLRLKAYKEVYHTTSKDRCAYKAVVQHYLDIQQDRVRSKNKIKGALNRHCYKDITGAAVFSKKNREAILASLPGLQWRKLVERLFGHFDWLDEQAKQAQAEMEKAGRSYPEVENFQRVPGVGPVGANVFSAILQTPDRFAHKGSVVRYCALSISDRSSDNKPIGYERLERGVGNRQLKRISYHFWLGAMGGKDNEVKTYYQACLKKNGNCTKKARLTTQRKIMTTLWAMWKNKTKYDPSMFAHSSPRTSDRRPKTKS